jgi:hypothetical protein
MPVFGVGRFVTSNKDKYQAPIKSLGVTADLLPKSLFMVDSVHGKPIRLTDTVWTGKILENHAEFAINSGYLEEVKITIEPPDFVVAGWSGEHLALRECKSAPGGSKSLCVVYRELDSDGFVITAFFISKPQKLLRRGIVWRRPS